MNNIKLALAEDNSFLRNSISKNLGLFPELKLKIISVNGKQLIKSLLKDQNIDVILMDIEMPEMDGIEATNIIKSKYPQIKIIILTIFDDEEKIINAINAGADGYLLKDTPPQVLLNSIKIVKENGSPLSPSIAEKTFNILKQANLVNYHSSAQNTNIKLTNREKDVLIQLSKGLIYVEIATNLNISVGTVRKHIENIYSKLNVHNKVEAIQKAKTHHLL
jgi:DNA-binding NarL/FixJ family response regulator